jgi:hypothetical protein
MGSNEAAIDWQVGHERKGALIYELAKKKTIV